MSLQPMTAHILFLFLLLGGAECLASSSLRAGDDSVGQGLTEWQACTEVVNDSLEYCCYHKRCQGNSTHQGLYINCDTSSNQCALNETGYPFCVENEQGGSYGICKKMVGYTCSCDHDFLASWQINSASVKRIQDQTPRTRQTPQMTQTPVSLELGVSCSMFLSSLLHGLVSACWTCSDGKAVLREKRTCRGTKCLCLTLNDS